MHTVLVVFVFTVVQIGSRLVRSESEVDQKHHGNRSVASSESVGEYHTGTDRELAGKPSSTIR